jgi:hypothetical protein
MTLRSLPQRADAWLLAAPTVVRRSLFALTLVAIVAQSLPHVPRVVVDYSRVPLLAGITQPETYGTDTIADMYEARVVLHDPRDMYTKRGVEQTPLEAATWSKAQSAPYPPLMLLTEAALLWIGQACGIGFYGMLILLAIAFLAMSAWYFSHTRWYVFPLLYLNFTYLAQRFVFVQDGSYLLVLVTVTAALLVARTRAALAHVLMAIAIDFKFSPLYYVTNIFGMKRRIAALFALLVVCGVILPLFLWRGYFDILRFNEGLKGHRSGAIVALACAVPFAALLWFVERRAPFDLEDRVGWSMVPFGMFLALKMNAPRHLLIALLIPDKRGWRNGVAAFALGLNAAFPSVVPLGPDLTIVTTLLFLVLVLIVHSRPRRSSPAWQVRSTS